MNSYHCDLSILYFLIFSNTISFEFNTNPAVFTYSPACLYYSSNNFQSCSSSAFSNACFVVAYSKEALRIYVSYYCKLLVNYTYYSFFLLFYSSSNIYWICIITVYSDLESNAFTKLYNSYLHFFTYSIDVGLLTSWVLFSSSIAASLFKHPIICVFTGWYLCNLLSLAGLLEEFECFSIKNKETGDGIIGNWGSYGWWYYQ